MPSWVSGREWTKEDLVRPPQDRSTRNQVPARTRDGFGGDGGESNSPSRTESPETSYRYFRPICASPCGPPTGGVLRSLSGDAFRLFDAAHRSRRRRTSPDDIFAVRGGGTVSMLTD